MHTARSVAVWLGYQQVQKGKSKGIDWPNFCILLEKAGYTEDTVDDNTPIADEIIFRMLLNTGKVQAKANRNVVIEDNLIPMLQQGQLPGITELLNSIPHVEPPKKVTKTKKTDKPPTIVQPPKEAEE